MDKIMRGNFLEKVSPHPFKNLETVLERKTANPSRIREGFLLFIRLLLQFGVYLFYLLFRYYFGDKKNNERNASPDAYKQEMLQKSLCSQHTKNNEEHRVTKTSTKNTYHSENPAFPPSYAKTKPDKRSRNGPQCHTGQQFYRVVSANSQSIMQQKNCDCTENNRTTVANPNSMPYIFHLISPPISL